MAIEIDLNEKYKLLYAEYAEIRKHFDDSNTSDDEYFHYGIYADILTNALSILINLTTQNEKSIGIDNNCRAILEAFAILELDKRGGIGARNKKMYRLYYSSIERKIYENNDRKRTELDQSVIDEAEKNFKRLQRIACDHYNCSPKDLRNSKKFGDPYFYLTNSLDEKTNIVSIVNNNNIELDDNTYMYTFFSIMIHPRCESDSDIEDFLITTRHGFIGTILEKVFKFVDTEIPQVDISNIKTIDESLSASKDYSDMINDLLNVFDHSALVVSHKTGPYTDFFIDKISYLLPDMLLCSFLGLNEMVTPKFKSFIEYYSVLNYLLRSGNKETKAYQTSGFVQGSRLQIDDFMKKFSSHYGKINQNIKDNLNYLYENYYKDAYSLDSFNKFIKNISEKNLYALYKDKTSYSRMVKDEISFLSEEDKDKTLSIYRASLNMEHASGYIFNQSPGLRDYYAVESIIISLSLFERLVKWIELIAKENNIQVDFSEDYLTLDSLIQTYQFNEYVLDEQFTKLVEDYYANIDNGELDA